MKRKSLHTVIAIIIGSVFSFQLFFNTIIVADFIIHQDYIAKNLCVQKDNQQGCNGKCHLSKTLKKANNEQQNSPQEYVKIATRFDYLSNKLDLEVTFFSLDSKTSWSQVFYAKTLNQYYEVITPPPNFI